MLGRETANRSAQSHVDIALPIGQCIVMIRNLIRRIALTLPWLWLAACILGALIRLSVRDGFPLLSVLFYATPIPVLAGLALLSATAWASSKRWIYCTGALLIAMGCILWWHRCSHFDNSSYRSRAEDSVMLWNVAHGRLGWDSIVDRIRAEDPDIIALIEADPQSVGAAEISTRLPEYQASTLYQGMQLMAKGNVKDIEQGSLAGRGYYRIINVGTDDSDYCAVLVDIHSSPLLSRQPPLEAIESIVSGIQNQPLLLMGDFNTPSDSVHFDRIRESCDNAFEDAGTGYAVTWPVPLPIMALDQIWVNKLVRSVRCELGWTWSSDHRPIILTIAGK